ncbi:MAG: ABC transporter permease subunit [Planctomycetota bacterium]
MTFRTLSTFYLRRHRLAFWLPLVFLLLHQVLFLYIFRLITGDPETATAMNTLMPDFVRDLMGMPEFDFRKPAHFLGMYYIRLEVRALILVFGVTIASNVIAGEVGRGTGDLLFSHPIRRHTAVLAGVAVVALQLCAVVLVLLAGLGLGATVFPMGEGQPGVNELLPSMGSLALGSFATVLLCFVAGSLCNSRAQAVGWGMAIVVCPIILKALSNANPDIGYVSWIFPEHWYRPHHILWHRDLPELPGLPFRRYTLANTWWPLAITSPIALFVAMLAADRRDLAK